MSVGFVGLGMMGLPMLENLARGGEVRLLAHDSDAARCEALQGWPGWGQSLRWSERLEQLAEAGTVLLMLPNSTITTQVVEALLPRLAPGAVIVDMGSSDPSQTQQLAARAAERGVDFVDAPVSGAVAKARTGSLSIMMGGSDAAIERVRPLLQRMGSTLIRTGAAGSAHAMKALNNYVYAAGLLAMTEAVAIAQRLQLDLQVFAQVLNASSGRNVATETKLAQFVLPRTFNGGFQMRLQAKDLATAHGLSQRAGVPAPQLALCAKLWPQALAALEPDADNTAILRYVESRTPF